MKLFFLLPVFGVKFLNRVNIRNFHECYPSADISPQKNYILGLDPGCGLKPKPKPKSIWVWIQNSIL